MVYACSHHPNMLPTHPRTTTASHEHYTPPGVTVTISPPPNPTTPQALGRGQWALDRIDQRDAALDGQYLPSTGGGGEGVTVYSLDSGVMVGHDEFKYLGGGGGSRASVGCVVHGG